METMKKSLSYKVTFNKPEYNAIYTFTRMESGAFSYGNKSMVCVEKNGEHHSTIDTRYDKLVMKDFALWCENYLEQAFNPIYYPVWEEINQ